MQNYNANISQFHAALQEPKTNKMLMVLRAAY